MTSQRPPAPAAGAPREESWPLLTRLAADGLSPSEMNTLPVLRSERILCLCRWSRQNDRAALSLLGELAPELGAMRRRLARLGADEEPAEAATLSVAWEIVSGRRGAHRFRSVRGLLETLWRALRQETGLRRLDHETVPLSEGLEVVAAGFDRLEHWPGLLAAALAAGVLSVRQVVIVAQSRMDERPLAEVARTLGRPYDAVRMERQRAERALRVFARSYEWGDSP